jgi:hypothetical protein
LHCFENFFIVLHPLQLAHPACQQDPQDQAGEIFSFLLSHATKPAFRVQ